MFFCGMENSGRTYLIYVQPDESETKPWLVYQLIGETLVRFACQTLPNSAYGVVLLHPCCTSNIVLKSSPLNSS